MATISEEAFMTSPSLRPAAFALDAAAPVFDSRFNAWITKQPRLLSAIEALDCVLSYPMAPLGDHVLYQLRHTSP
jgi:hypothetical protein